MGNRRRGDDSFSGLLIGLGVAAAGAALLHYLTSGVGEADASLIPNSIEDRLDRVVEMLNRKFGKRWVNQALGTLRSGLASVLPPPLVALVEVVHQVERVGAQYNWSGYQKRCEAAGLCRG